MILCKFSVETFLHKQLTVRSNVNYNSGKIKFHVSGLSNAITSQNKGFAMLTKMGYKQGEAIGKSSNGILEPIGIDIKTDRGGLGRDAALKQLKEHRQLIRLNRIKTSDGNSTISTDEFRKRMTQKAQGKTL